MKKLLIGGAVLAALTAGVVALTRVWSGTRDGWEDCGLTGHDFI